MPSLQHDLDRDDEEPAVHQVPKEIDDIVGGAVLGHESRVKARNSSMAISSMCSTAAAMRSSRLLK